MFRKLVKKIITIVAAITAIMLSACSSVSNLTPQKVIESDNGVYTLTMAAKVRDNNVVRGTERPYIVIDGEKYLMKIALNLRNEVMYQYDYTFPQDKDAVSYYYVIEYKARENHGKLIVDKAIDSGEMFVLRPLNKLVSGLKTDSGFIGSTATVQGIGFDKDDAVFMGGKEVQVTSISKKALEFIVPTLPANKRYDIEIKHGDGAMSWVGSYVIKPRDFLVSPTKIFRESGQSLNIIFDIGFKAPVGGCYIDVQTNIPSSVVMPEITIAEGESSIAVPVKFAAAGMGYLFINAEGFREKVLPVEVRPLAPTALDLLVEENDEVSEKILIPETKENKVEVVEEVTPVEVVEETPTEETPTEEVTAEESVEVESATEEVAPEESVETIEVQAEEETPEVIEAEVLIIETTE